MADNFKKILINKMGPDWKFARTLKDDSDQYICLFDAKDINLIPNKMAVGINKHTGKTAFNHLSLEKLADALR